MTYRTWIGRAALVALLAGTVVGCSHPRGESRGRIGLTSTSKAEEESQKVLPAALIEFSDQVPARLIQDLYAVEQWQNTDQRVTVLLGDINNRTKIVSSGDFEVAASRIRNNLINSPVGRERFKFVERRARMTDLAARERVASNGQLAEPADYDPATTYALNGDFFRISRGETNYYYMEFQLVHFASGEIVFSDRYEIKRATP